MAPKRGMSLEDKRTTLLNIFHETKEVYQLKDVEKLAVKRGVVLQSVKDVLQSLVDDDLVHAEKVGVSNYFWSFPGEAAARLEAEAARTAARLAERRAERAALEPRLAAARAGKDDGAERAAAAAEVAALEARLAAARAALADLAGADPERLDALRAAAPVARDAANRWIDNTEALRSWMRKALGVPPAQVDAFLAEQGFGDSVDAVEI